MPNSKKKKLPCGRPAPDHDHSISEKQIEQWRIQLDQYIASQSMKSSQQRWMIAELVLRSDKHLSAQDVVKLVQEEHPKIGAATVYRNLKIFVESGVLHETFLSHENMVVYEPNVECHHDHIICNRCGAIFEFHNDEIEKIQRNILAKMEFQEKSHKHVLYVDCSYKQ